MVRTFRGSNAEQKAYVYANARNIPLALPDAIRGPLKGRTTYKNYPATDYPPGSQGKQRVMATRAKYCLPLFHPNDRPSPVRWEVPVCKSHLPK